MKARGQWELCVAVAVSGKRVAVVAMDVGRARAKIQRVLDQQGIAWPPTLEVLGELPGSQVFELSGLDESTPQD